MPSSNDYGPIRWRSVALLFLLALLCHPSNIIPVRKQQNFVPLAVLVKWFSIFVPLRASAQKQSRTHQSVFVGELQGIRFL